MLEEVNADITEFDWDNNDIDADDLKHYINAAPSLSIWPTLP